MPSISQQHSSIHPRTSCSHTPAHNLTAAQLTADVQRLSPLPANPTHLSLPHPPATVLPHPAVPAHRPPPSCQRSCVTFGVRVSRLRFWGQGFGARILGLGSRGSGLGLGSRGSEFEGRVSGPGCGAYRRSEALEPPGWPSTQTQVWASTSGMQKDRRVRPPKKQKSDVRSNMFQKSRK